MLEYWVDFELLCCADPTWTTLKGKFQTDAWFAVFSHILHCVHCRDILHKKQINSPKLAEENERYFYINLAILTVISESLIEFAKFPCNKNILFYQLLGEVNRKKQKETYYLHYNNNWYIHIIINIFDILATTKSLFIKTLLPSIIKEL